MGRLIDVDALIEKMRTINTLYGTPITERDKQMIHWIVGHINEQPTAYDVEKVVAELGELEDTNTREVYLTKHICLDDAIDIVKRGGRSEKQYKS